MNPRILLPLLLAATSVSAQSKSTPDTIYFHGNILTGAHLRTDDTSVTPARVSAIAITNGRVTATGTDAQVLALKFPTTKLVDLHGAFAMPGFNDAHTHIASAGQQKLTVDLDNTPSLAAMQATIKAYAATLSAQTTWITGGGWDHTKWASSKLPSRQDLDAVTGAHPAVLERTDGHIAVLNTAALAATGINAATTPPTGGSIDHDPDGEPTGIVRDTALAVVRAKIPPPDAATRRRALTLALNDASAHGVTSVQDLSDWQDFLVLEQLEREGQLHVRVSEWLTFNDPLDTLKAHRAHHSLADPMLHTGMLKGFMDGSLGSRTAALAAPYSDDPANSGLARYNQDKLNAMTGERAAAGFQIGFHAIGDRANNMALNALEIGEIEQARTMPNALSPIHRIEHAQVLLPTDFDRFAKLHIIASMQPSHLLTDMAWAGDRLGPERSKYAYAWRSFLNHNVTLAFGTDYPVESVNPFRGLYAAVTRMNESGTQTFQPQEKLTLNEALYAYTQGSAICEYLATQKGRLEPGFLADIVVLDRDITKSSPQELLHTHILRTVLGGETVYTAPATPTAETLHRSVPDGD